MNSTYIFNVAPLYKRLNKELIERFEAAAFYEDPHLDGYTDYSRQDMIRYWFHYVLDHRCNVFTVQPIGLDADTRLFVECCSDELSEALYRQTRAIDRRLCEAHPQIRLTRFDLYLYYPGVLS